MTSERPQVVVLTAAYGSGHRMAARALEEALEERGVPVRTLDSTEYSRMEAWAARFYRELADWGHYLWLGVYVLGRFVPASVRIWIVGFRSRRIGEALQELQPRGVVSTHLFGGDVVSFLKRRRHLSPHLVTVITDYEAHPAWVNPGTDLYVVGASETREAYVRMGVAPERIVDWGIPVRRMFREARRDDPRDLRRELGLDPERFTVLFLAGALGVTPVERFFPYFQKITAPVQWLFITGKNRDLRRRVEEALARHRLPGKVYGFREDIARFMQAADLLITKGGGLTVAEALALGKPLLFVHPMPGQEQGNAHFVQRHGAGYYLKKKEELPRLVELLARDPDWHGRLRERAATLGRPDAAVRIVDHLIRQVSIVRA